MACSVAAAAAETIPRILRRSSETKGTYTRKMTHILNVGKRQLKVNVEPNINVHQEQRMKKQKEHVLQITHQSIQGCLKVTKMMHVP